MTSSEVQVALSTRQRLASVEQGTLVLAVTAVAVVVGAMTTSGFLTAGNFSVILQLSAAFGIVAVGEALVILGKGVDLSVGAVALVTAQATLELQGRGIPESQAILIVLGLVAVVGLVNGLLVAFVEVPSLFVTLGTGQLLLGGVNAWLLERNHYFLPEGSAIGSLARGSVLGLPTAVVCAAVIFTVAWLYVSYTSYGRLTRAMGDNFDAARIGAAPVRPLQVSTYLASALLAALAGYITIAREGSAVTTGTAFSPLLFTALTVAVIGGVSLVGGRGSITGVLTGTLFIGIVANLLTLNNFGPAVQNIVNGAILVCAVTLDAWLHPRDEETAKSDDL